MRIFFAMATAAYGPEIFQLPKKESLALAERLWLSVADESSMPVPEAHKIVLKKRLADYKAGRVKAISHAELMKRVRGL